MNRLSVWEKGEKPRGEGRKRLKRVSLFPQTESLFTGYFIGGHIIKVLTVQYIMKSLMPKKFEATAVVAWLSTAGMSAGGGGMGRSVRLLHIFWHILLFFQLL